MGFTNTFQLIIVEKLFYFSNSIQKVKMMFIVTENDIFNAVTSILLEDYDFWLMKIQKCILLINWNKTSDQVKNCSFDTTC